MFLPILFSVFLCTCAHASLPLSGKQIIVQFEDNVEHPYPIEHLNLFVTIKNMLEELESSVTGQIPLPTIPNKELFETLINSRIVFEENKTKDDAALQVLLKPYTSFPSIISDTFRRLLMGANYLDGEKRFLSLLFNGFKNMEPSLEEMPYDLSFNAAGKLMEDLLQDPTIRGSSIHQPMNDLSTVGSGSSKNGVAYYMKFDELYKTGPSVQYYQIKDSALKYKTFMNLPHPAVNVLHCGVSPDDLYVYALYTFYTAEHQSSSSQSSQESKKTRRLILMLRNMQTQKVKNIPLIFDLEDLTDSAISYNSNTQQFLLFFPRYSVKGSIFAFCSFNADKPTIEVAANEPLAKTQHLHWQFIDNLIIAVHSTNKKFLYEPSSHHIISQMSYNSESQRGSYIDNLQEKTTPPFIVLKSKAIIGLAEPSYHAYPSSFIPNYQTILNNRIKRLEPTFTTKYSHLVFDPSNLRYLGYERKPDSSAFSYKYTVYIADMFPQSLVEALKIINQKWFLSTTRAHEPYYTNILYDAWYIYHAEKQTDLFLNLQENSPLLAKVSPEVKTIYSLLTASQKAEVLKKRAERSNALSAKLQVLSSSWKPVNLFKSLQQNVGAFLMERYANLSIFTKNVLLPSVIATGIIFSPYFVYLLQKNYPLSFSPKDWSLKRLR